MFRTVIDQVPEYTFDYSLAKIQFNLFSVAEYKLVYFPLKGRAQTIRYLLEDNAIEYEFVPVKMDNWAEYKPKTIFGQLPVLHHGDFELAQSHSIVRYLASRHGLCGDSKKETALINMIYDAAYDVFFDWASMQYSKDGEFEEKNEAFLKALPEKLAHFEKLLKKNNDGKGFFVGEKISMADYPVFDFLEILNRYKPGCLDTVPLLKAFHDRMLSRDRIKAFLSRDDIKAMPVTASGRF